MNKFLAEFLPKLRSSNTGADKPKANLVPVTNALQIDSSREMKRVIEKSRLRPKKQRRKADSKHTEPEKKGVSNTSSLAVLPDELLLEIVSYLPYLPASSENHTSKRCYGLLSTTRSLPCLVNELPTSSAIFSPLRVETTWDVAIGETILRPRSGKKGEAAYATELGLLEIVTIRDPSLAEYVQYQSTWNAYRIANFEITDFSIDSVLVELGRCFSLFPNLHTVKLDMDNFSRRWDMVTVVNGFAKHIL